MAANSMTGPRPSGSQPSSLDSGELEQAKGILESSLGRSAGTKVEADIKDGVLRDLGIDPEAARAALRDASRAAPMAPQVEKALQDAGGGRSSPTERVFIGGERGGDLFAVPPSWAEPGSAKPLGDGEASATRPEARQAPDQAPDASPPAPDPKVADLLGAMKDLTTFTRQTLDSGGFGKGNASRSSPSPEAAETPGSASASQGQAEPTTPERAAVTAQTSPRDAEPEAAVTRAEIGNAGTTADLSSLASRAFLNFAANRQNPTGAEAGQPAATPAAPKGEPGQASSIGDRTGVDQQAPAKAESQGSTERLFIGSEKGEDLFAVPRGWAEGASPSTGPRPEIAATDNHGNTVPVNVVMASNQRVAAYLETPRYNPTDDPRPPSLIGEKSELGAERPASYTADFSINDRYYNLPDAGPGKAIDAPLRDGDGALLRDEDGEIRTRQVSPEDHAAHINSGDKAELRQAVLEAGFATRLPGMLGGAAFAIDRYLGTNLTGLLDRLSGGEAGQPGRVTQDQGSVVLDVGQRYAEPGGDRSRVLAETQVFSRQGSYVMHDSRLDRLAASGFKDDTTPHSQDGVNWGGKFSFDVNGNQAEINYPGFLTYALEGRAGDAHAGPAMGKACATHCKMATEAMAMIAASGGSKEDVRACAQQYKVVGDQLHGRNDAIDYARHQVEAAMDGGKPKSYVDFLIDDQSGGAMRMDANLTSYARDREISTAYCDKAVSKDASGMAGQLAEALSDARQDGRLGDSSDIRDGEKALERLADGHGLDHDDVADLADLIDEQAVREALGKVGVNMLDALIRREAADLPDAA